MEQKIYINPNTPQQEIIKKIQSEIGDYKIEKQSILVQNLFKIISTDIYSDERRFVAEIIQNSDDASVKANYLRIHIHFFDNHILIGHYGKPFDENDVFSICYAGSSTKRNNKETTGYKGIGFKSVFTFSNKVFIISDGFQFRFDENYSKNKSYPWQIYPIWSNQDDLENQEIFGLAKDFKVGIIIELKNKKIMEECRNFFLEFKNDQTYLLYLKCSEVEIKIFNNKIQNLKIVKKTNKDNPEKVFIECEDKSYEKNRNDLNNSDNKKGNSNKNLINSYFIKKYGFNMSEMVKENLISKDDLEKIKIDEQIPSKLKDLENIDFSFAVKINKFGDKILELEKNERLIYSYLPTRVNYNFPFILNSNFILDAGRSLLKENIFNKCLISILPKYISIFQENIREIFYNQYSMVLVDDFHIDNKYFNNIFTDNLKKEIEKFKLNIVLFANKKIRKNYKEIYYECLLSVKEQKQKNSNKLKKQNVENQKVRFNSIKEYTVLDFFLSLTEDGETRSDLKMYLKKFFKKTRFIDYCNENRIDFEDREHVKKISAFYSLKHQITFINFDDVVEFLKSEFYPKIYSPQILFNLLNKLKHTTFLNLIKEYDPEIFKNSIGDYVGPSMTYFYEVESKNLVENEKTNFNISCIDKNELNLDIFDLFYKSNKLQILIDVGVKQQNSSQEVESILKNIDLYDENNSYRIIKILFHQWRKEINNKKRYIEALKNRKLHTKSKGFLHPHCVILEQTFSKSENSSIYSDWYLNENYFKYIFESSEEKNEHIDKVNVSEFEDHPNINLEDKELGNEMEIDDKNDFQENENRLVKVEKNRRLIKFKNGRRYNNENNKKDKSLKKESRNLEDFIKFFKDLEIWIEPINFYYVFNKDNFFDCPFLDINFINMNRKLILKEYSFPLFISTKFKNLYNMDIQSICDFFNFYISYILDEEKNELIGMKNTFKNRNMDDKAKKRLRKDILEFGSQDDKKVEFRLNYFRWFFEEKGKLVPTSRLDLQSVDKILSHDLLKRFDNEIKNEIKNLYLETLDFCYSEHIHFCLKNANFIFNSEIKFYQYCDLLKNLHKKYIETYNEINKKSDNIAEINPEINLIGTRKISYNENFIIKNINLKKKNAAKTELEKNKLKIDLNLLLIAIKTEYKNILEIIYKNENLTLPDDVFLIDEDDNFCKPNELCYEEKIYKSPNKPVHFKNKSNLKNVYIPQSILNFLKSINFIDETKMDINQYKTLFINFLSNNKVKIKNEKNYKIIYGDLQETNEFDKHYRRFIELFLKKIRLDKEKYSINVECYSAEEIFKSDEMGDIMSELRFNYEFDTYKKLLKIYYRKETERKDWKTPTNLLNICKCICKILEISKLIGYVLTFFNISISEKNDLMLDEFCDELSSFDILDFNN